MSRSIVRRNYENLFNFIKVMLKILVVSFFSGHSVYLEMCAGLPLTSNMLAVNTRVSNVWHIGYQFSWCTNRQKILQPIIGKAIHRAA